MNIRDKNKTKIKKPLVLIILDGWGIAPQSSGNAIALARTPIMTKLWQKYPHAMLIAHGKKVGLPPYQDGNSEAGHLNLGAGRIIGQDSVMISRSINQGTFFKNNAFQEAVRHVKKNKSNFHLMGLLTYQQSAHADPDHLLALLTFLKIHKVKNFFLHLFTDGRDSPRFAAIKLLENLKKSFNNQEIVATVMGRFYAMDRKKKWNRTKLAYEAMVLGQGIKVKNSEEAVLQAYNRGESDEFILPSIIYYDHQPNIIRDNDAVVFFNLRSDRARQLAKPFVQKNFENLGGFRRQKILKNLYFVAMTDFGPDLGEIATAFPSIDLQETLPVVLKDYAQLYIAESEKYAHVTYFFNGGYADPIGGEERIVIPSPDVPAYDEKPEMSAREITSTVIGKIKKNQFDFITLNFANPDMVGHTGNLEAGVMAVEVVDSCLGKICQTILEKKAVAVITADHGNVEEMINLKTGEVDTEHSKNPVPFLIFNESHLVLKRKIGILADVAPTILNLMGVHKPSSMKGKSFKN